MYTVTVHAPNLASYADWLREQISEPVEIRVTPTFRDEDALPLVADAYIVVTSHWSQALGEAAGSMRFLQMPGAGWDKIDPEGIPEGVLVANCYEHEQGIAEYVMMMALALNRKLLEADRTIRMGVWRLFPAVGHPLYPELGGQTMGIVGLGRIGRAVAKLAGAFGMRRIGVDNKPLSDEARRETGLDRADGPDGLDQLLAESDVVVIATTLGKTSRGMFNAERFAKMKSGAFLINPARAEICVEGDLYRALRDRVIAGAALDPWWHYPKDDEVVAPSKYPFGELDNVIMTPHTSGSTVETFDRRLQVVADNINRFLRGEPVINVVAELSRAKDAVGQR